ncbi:MAG: hypothetical protein ACI4U9_01620 [Clostridia bacterium]
MEELILIILEKVVEAIYFSMFLIIGKNIKNKKLLFIGIMVFEYLMLKHFIKYSVYFQLAYTFMSYVNLKVLYKEKAQITDIFLFTAASLLLIAISAASYGIVYITVREYFVALILNRILLFSTLYFARKFIREKYKSFCSLWNRHNIPNTIKSLTLRNISIITFNLMFWLINLGMLIAYNYYH